MSIGFTQEEKEYFGVDFLVEFSKRLEAFDLMKELINGRIVDAKLNSWASKIIKRVI